jgi:hypothetical protein
MPKCQSEHYFRDFDGSSESMPCGAEATHKVTTNSPYLKYYIESVGGWEEFRQGVLNAGEPDVGEDPGYDHWGVDSTFVCGEHLKEVLEGADTEDQYGYEILTNEPLNVTT